jgi:hypothetical protein
MKGLIDCKKKCPEDIEGTEKVLIQVCTYVGKLRVIILSIFPHSF